jgi:hypothetical protein
MTLTDGNNTLTLPDDLTWEDEDWQPVTQDAAYTLTGALVIETATKQAGRPITLKSPDNQAVITGSQLNALRAWAGIAGKVMTLTLRNQSRNVVFRHSEGALNARLLGHWRDPIPDTALYFVTLRFMEI